MGVQVGLAIVKGVRSIILDAGQWLGLNRVVTDQLQGLTITGGASGLSSPTGLNPAARASFTGSRTAPRTDTNDAALLAHIAGLGVGRQTGGGGNTTNIYSSNTDEIRRQVNTSNTPFGPR